MKYFIKENWFKLLLLIAVIALVTLSSKETTNETTKVFSGYNLSSATSITCSYPQTLSASYSYNEISHALPEPETNPIIFTFSELNDPDAGKLSYIDATQTITNVPIIKLIEDEEKTVYIEGVGGQYLTIHTIYKKIGISTYTKNINFMNKLPVVTSAMGSCSGY